MPKMHTEMQVTVHAQCSISFIQFEIKLECVNKFQYTFQYHISAKSIHKFLSCYRQKHWQGGRQEDIHQAIHFCNFFIVNALNVKVVTEQPLGISGSHSCKDYKIIVFWDVIL